ncbi:MAG: hypothetical protein E7624_01025 [Ruminococcaceae bacterium]|nr:hypothetical protein [Oscillospiraceae bacterium]
MKRGVLLLIAATLLVSALSGCRREGMFSAGEKLSPAEIEALQQSLLSEENSDVQNGALGVEDLPDDAECYFVLGSGTVYHTDKKCSYIKNSKNLTFGTISDALASGKTRLCSACGKGSDGEGNTSNEELTPEELERICYFAAGGSVWHDTPTCSALAQSKEVISATVKEAIAAGKTRACSKCAN